MTKNGESFWVSPRFVVLACLFVTSLLISNIIAGKLIQVWGLVLPAAVIIFPLTYIFGDILTEVYGFKRSRFVIWVGFAANILMAAVFLLTIALPYPDYWTGQTAYAAVLGFTPRLILASLVAYFAGEFVNATLLSKMKVLTQGKWLWTRTIGSTLVGEGLDTILFISIGFVGILTPANLGMMILAQYLFKVGFEVVATPLTYAVVKWLKDKEGQDTFDYGISYNPFHWGVNNERA